MMTTPDQKIILVVDDEPDVRRFFETALKDAGFGVVTASDGDEALTVLNNRPPDLISLDLVMPRKSGVKLYHELRRNKAWSRIPVLVVTAHAHDEMGSADLNSILKETSISGPGVYLEKPVTAKSYVAAVKKMLKIEETAPEEDTVSLKEELADKLRKADPETLKKMLDMLKNN